VPQISHTSMHKQGREMLLMAYTQIWEISRIPWSPHLIYTASVPVTLTGEL
jgi:hypothetical protein